MDGFEPGAGEHWRHAADVDTSDVATFLNTAKRNERREDTATLLFEVVASEIIPRLLTSCKAAPYAVQPQAAHIETLLQLSLSRDAVAAASQLCSLRASGMSMHALMDALLAPAARRLGELWMDDALDFVEVALAAGKLGAGIRRLDALSPTIASPRAPSAMFMTLETERHGLGAMSVAATFRDAGWRTCEMLGAPTWAAASAAEAQDFDVFALSVSDPSRRHETSLLVASLRKASANRRVVIAVGGSACRQDDEFATRVGADFSAQGCADAITTAGDAIPRQRRLEAVS